MTKVMIYGAAGYTGRMAAANAKTHGLDLVLAGRAQAEARLALLAEELDGEYRLFASDGLSTVEAALGDLSVLLNCAGPFLHTAEPLMRACIARGVHYLDIAAEMDSYRLAEALGRTRSPLA